jgi:hypothetical protein
MFTCLTFYNVFIPSQLANKNNNTNKFTINYDKL